jgi:hypothetical protein
MFWMEMGIGWDGRQEDAYPVSLNTNTNTLPQLVKDRAVPVPLHDIQHEYNDENKSVNLHACLPERSSAAPKTLKH